MLLNDQYRKFRFSLKKKNLMYIKQLFFPSCGKLKEWGQLNIETNLIQRGRIPKWWTQIITRIKNLFTDDTWEDVGLKNMLIDMDLKTKDLINQPFLPSLKIDYRKRI